VTANAVEDARALAEGGAHGVMLENFGDVPFHPDRVPAVTVAALTVVASAVGRAVGLPLGINVLRNDALSALAVAAAVGARWIRVNVLCGARVTDQGVLQGRAHEVLRRRRDLGLDDVLILADVDVKHSAPLGAPRPLEEDVRETLQRAGADAVVVSGSGTGAAPEPERVNRARRAAGEAPVLLGSGLSVDNAAELLAAADGAVVGSSLKRGGRLEAPVDPLRVRELVRVVAALPPRGGDGSDDVPAER
jgi:membrane complex biogenesis BtpA family protein